MDHRLSLLKGRSTTMKRRLLFISIARCWRNLACSWLDAIRRKSNVFRRQSNATHHRLYVARSFPLNFVRSRFVFFGIVYVDWFSFNSVCFHSTLVQFSFLRLFRVLCTSFQFPLIPGISFSRPFFCVCFSFHFLLIFLVFSIAFAFMFFFPFSFH